MRKRRILFLCYYLPTKEERHGKVYDRISEKRHQEVNNGHISLTIDHESHHSYPSAVRERPTPQVVLRNGEFCPEEQLLLLLIVDNWGFWGWWGEWRGGRETEEQYLSWTFASGHYIFNY